VTVRPLIVAHRGSSAAVPEHTLASYQRALEEGADGLECDVRLTADGQLVCVHDRRLDRTSTGRGSVSATDLETLEALDFGSWHADLPDRLDELVLDPARIDPDVRAARQRVLTFNRLLELVEAWTRPVLLLVETKHPVRFGALVEIAVVDALRSFGLVGRPDDASRAAVMSFSSSAVRRVIVMEPDLPTVLLLDDRDVRWWGGRLPAGCGIAGPGIHLLREDPAYAHRAHARRHEIYVWTVDEESDADLARGLGAAALITNRPAAIRAHLAEVR